MIRTLLVLLPYFKPPIHSIRIQNKIPNPQDFFIKPKRNEVYDFIHFARTEGRFVKHFDKDGNPSETLIRAKQERLDNWHTLQELAGLFDRGKISAAEHTFPDRAT